MKKKSKGFKCSMTKKESDAVWKRVSERIMINHHEELVRQFGGKKIRRTPFILFLEKKIKDLEHELIDISEQETGASL